MKDKEYHVTNFGTFVSKLLFFPPKNWMNLISNWPSPVFGQFQNGCNKVVIEPCVMQFWSESILVISNQTLAVHSFNYEITHMISTKFHSTQFNYHYKHVSKSIPIWATVLMQKKPIRRQTLTDLFHSDGCDAHQDLLSLTFKWKHYSF